MCQNGARRPAGRGGMGPVAPRNPGRKTWTWAQNGALGGDFGTCVPESIIAPKTRRIAATRLEILENYMKTQTYLFVYTNVKS